MWIPPGQTQQGTTNVAEVDSGLKRKRATGDDGAGPSKRVRHFSLGLSTSTEEETPDALPTLAAKEVTETPPPEQVMLRFQLVTAQQAALVAQLRARFANERSQSIQRD
ncbi:hypothetical protein Tco_0732299, partial [Tanacetum coccineum]